MLILTPEQKPHDALKLCDGLLLSGGGDILPELFGICDYDRETIRDQAPERDIFELTLARIAFYKELPTLGICRGMQIMNTALGGELFLDIPGHMQGLDRDLTSHSVFTSKGSRLERLLGNFFEVNSFHHQSVSTLPRELIVSAKALPDRHIEGIEASDRFFIGVQWHPECLYESFWALFDALIEAADKFGRA